MAKTSFSIDDELYLEGQGSMTVARRITGEIYVGNCIRKSITFYKNIDQEYMEALSNDGKIVGRERNEIIVQIDIFFNMLLLIWKSMEDEKKKEMLIIINDRKSKFYLSITEKSNLWKARGRLSPHMIRPLKNFRIIYNKKLAAQIIELLKKYGTAIADEKLDDTEIKDLRQTLKQIIYYTLFLRFQIENCLISA